MLVLVTGDEIEQWEQKDPDNIDKVPVEPADVHRRVIGRRVLAGVRLPQQKVTFR